MSEEKKAEHINIRVLGQDNAIVQFKIKKHTPMRKLMVAFCERSRLAKEAVRFRFDGAPINELDTPETLEMEEGDMIEVFQPQSGGFGFCTFKAVSLFHYHNEDSSNVEKPLRSTMTHLLDCVPVVPGPTLGSSHIFSQRRSSLRFSRCRTDVSDA